MTAKTQVTASDLRTYFNADARRLAKLSDKARKTVEKVDGRFPKGQVHPEAIDLHNKTRRTVEYTRGATAALRTAAKADAVALRERAKAAGFEVGDRGPLPKAAREALATAKPKRVRKPKVTEAPAEPVVETPADEAPASE